MAAGRHHRRPRAGAHQRGSSLPRSIGDLAGIEIVEVDGLGADARCRADDAKGLLGLGEVGTDEIGAGLGGLDQPSGRDIDGHRAAPLVDELDQDPVGTLGDTGRHAATDRDDSAGLDRLGDRGQDVVPVVGGERRPRLVDHGGPAVGLDDDRGAAELAPDRDGGDGETFGAQHVDGNAAEATRKRADELGRGVERERGPAHVDRLAAGRDGGVGRAEHLTGCEAGSRIVRSIVWLRPTTNIDRTSPFRLRTLLTSMSDSDIDVKSTLLITARWRGRIV